MTDKIHTFIGLLRRKKKLLVTSYFRNTRNNFVSFYEINLDWQSCTLRFLPKQKLSQRKRRAIFQMKFPSSFLLLGWNSQLLQGGERGENFLSRRAYLRFHEDSFVEYGLSMEFIETRRFMDSSRILRRRLRRAPFKAWSASSFWRRFTVGRGPILSKLNGDGLALRAS